MSGREVDRVAFFRNINMDGRILVLQSKISRICSSTNHERENFDHSILLRNRTPNDLTGDCINNIDLTKRRVVLAKVPNIYFNHTVIGCERNRWLKNSPQKKGDEDHGSNRCGPQQPSS